MAIVPAPAALGTLAGIRFVLGFGFSHFGAFVVVAVAVAIFISAPAALLLEARAALAEHSEIMVGELQIIFGLDAVATKLGVARHALVFLEQLGGVTALPVVLAIAAAASGHSLWALPTATTTTAALTIIDQAVFPYRTGALFKRPKTFHSKVLVSRDQAAFAEALAAPVLSYAQSLECMGQWRRGWRRRRFAIV